MTPPFSVPSTERDAALRLLASLQRARRALVAYGEACASRLDLSFQELIVLNELVGTAHPTVVARSTGIPASTVSRLLRSLEDRGLVKRAVDAADLRRFHVSLTSEGKRIVKESQDCIASSIEPRMGVLGKRRVEQLFRALYVLEESA